MSNLIDRKRIIVYLSFAFGIAWVGEFILITTGLAEGSLADGTSTLTLVLEMVVYMGAPAEAHLLTRLITREGWQNLYLRPKLRQGWPYWVLCWLAPPLFVFLGAAVYFGLFPQYYDPSLALVRQTLAVGLGPTAASMDPWTIVMTQALTTMLLAPIINAVLMLGEEFGWRAYLQPKLMPLGGRNAVLITGVIWGVWHWPMITMGLNYGTRYPGAPWLGPLAMIWFTLVFGTFLGWAALRAGSVWPAVIGHGALNEIAGVVLVFVQGEPNLLLGPIVAGVIGSIAFAAVALLLFLIPGALEPVQAARPVSQQRQPTLSSSNA